MLLQTFTGTWVEGGNNHLNFKTAGIIAGCFYLQDSP
jgi:hypothetical protein